MSMFSGGRRRFIAWSCGTGGLLTLHGIHFSWTGAAAAALSRGTPVYWDPELGVDGEGRGFSEDKPLKTLDFCLRRHLANDRVFLQRRGTTFRMASSQLPNGKLGIFIGGAQNVGFGAYGKGSAKAKIICIDAVESIFYFKDVSGWTVADYELDGAGQCRYGAIQVRASARDITGGAIIACDIHHSAGHGVYLHTANSVYPFTRLPVMGGIHLTGVVSHHNRLHGFVHGGAIDGINYLNCIAHHNGESGDGSGWHGFSALAHRQATGGYGARNQIPWERLTGDVWRTPVFPGQGAEIWRVSSRLPSPFSKLRRNADTPSTPRVGEFGVTAAQNVLRWPDGDRISSGYLHVNVGGADVGGVHRHNFQYAYTEAKNAVYFGCVAHHNHDGSSKHGYIEGTGFQFDDFSSDSRYESCLSYQNEGCGFQFNLGDNNRMTGCIAWANDSLGLLVQRHGGAIIANNVFDGNSLDTRGRRRQSAETAFTNDSVNTLFINNIVSGGRGEGVMFASGSERGSTARNNCVWGFSRPGLVRDASGTLAKDPGFINREGRDYRLKADSPCIRAGADPGIVPMAFGGRPMQPPYDIGAHDSKAKN